MAYAMKLKVEGRMVDAEGLADDVKVIRGTSSECVVTDVTHSDTEEIIGGYFIFTAKDWDEAAEIAKGCSAMDHGSRIELRPASEYGG